MNFNNKDMSVSNMLRNILMFEDLRMIDLAERLGKSNQTLCMKFKQGDFKESDLIKIGDALGYDVVIEFNKRIEYEESEVCECDHDNQTAD